MSRRDSSGQRGSPALPRSPRSPTSRIDSESGAASALQRCRDWFKRKGWKPFPFQEQAWADYLSGISGLIHSATGTGKTQAAAFGPIIEWLMEAREPRESADTSHRVLWVTPLRALANDTADSWSEVIAGLGLPWTVEIRTGDTAASARARQRKRLPTVLITTPESLSVLLSYPETREQMSTLRCVVVDEWHELLATKRGTQGELCLAHLRNSIPRLRTWGLSATLGNLPEALSALVGPNSRGARLVSGELEKRVEVLTLIPADVEAFPMAGHLGLDLLPQVLKLLGDYRTTLLFTNTRSQTESWFRALEAAKPGWKGEIALHHGSIDRAARETVEERLRSGTIRCVVCTSSLDLGVDFSPVDQVIQVGAPKGVARMIQRAGRSGHQPGAVSRIICVPAHALELVEFAAVRDAISEGAVEARSPVKTPLDVLVQHLVTIAMGSGFKSDEMLAEVRSTRAYSDLTDNEWQWCLQFITQGGSALRAYPQFSRVQEIDGFYRAAGSFAGHLHRMSIGTITSDSSVLVRFVRGAVLGTVEESFIGRLKPGSRFSFAGHTLELVRVRDMTAYVRRSNSRRGVVTQWLGGRMPLSSQLAQAVREKLTQAHAGKFAGAEMEAARSVLLTQARWSRIPESGELLVERLATREGLQHFIFPFAGRLVHEGLAALVSYRISRLIPASISITLNDYGFALLSGSASAMPVDEWHTIFSPGNVLDDLLASLNANDLARRQFREISRIAGLVFQGFPGRSKSMRQLQSSSGLFYDVFARYDPGNLLLKQAEREVLDRQLDLGRLRGTLEQLSNARLVFCDIPRLTPLSFPLWASFVQATVSSESWSDRIQRMAARLQAVVRSERANSAS